MGFGPVTGRGMGPCARRGMGWRNGCSYGRFISPKNELAALEEDEKALERELEMIREEKSVLEKEVK